MRNRSGRTGRLRWIALGVVALVVAGAAGIALWRNQRTPATRTATRVAVAADRGEVVAEVAATGTVQAATTRSLSFTAAGTVETVLVRPGVQVRSGTVLATVDDTTAQAAVDAAVAALTDAQTQLTTAKAAARATAADAAAASLTATPTPIAVAAEPGAGTGGRSPAAGDAIFSAQEQVNEAAAAVKTARAALAGTTIKAPLAGRVMAVSGKVGSQVTPGSAFITLAGTATMQVSADFPEADAGAIKAGQDATVTLADRVGVDFTAKVAQIDPLGTSNGTLVTYGVLLTFSKPPADLLIGQSAAVAVQTGRIADTLRVPSTAVHNVLNGSGTILVGTGGAASRRTVKVGLRGDLFTQITSGISAGDTVIRSW